METPDSPNVMTLRQPCGRCGVTEITIAICGAIPADFDLDVWTKDIECESCSVLSSGPRKPMTQAEVELMLAPQLRTWRYLQFLARIYPVPAGGYSPAEREMMRELSAGAVEKVAPEAGDMPDEVAALLEGIS